MGTVVLAQEKNESAILEELRQEIKEVNEYLEHNMEPLDIKNQTVTHVIPLSNGKEAEYTLTISQAVKGRTILDAKLGTWYFDSTLKLANHGQIKTRTTVDITYVPEKQGEGVPKFVAYDGTVSAIPDQYVSVDNTYAETVCVEPNYKYKTTGYVGFNIGGIAANYYFDQTITYVDNAENYNKIQCVLVGEF